MELKIGSIKLSLFDSIEDLNFERFSKFNKYMMLDAELGSSLQDFDRLVVRVDEFIRKEMFEDARKELMNMRITYNNILEEKAPKGLAFAIMIKSINGKSLVDTSKDNLVKVLQRLSKEGLTIKQVHEANQEIKKK